MIRIEIILGKVCHGSELHGYRWTWIESKWVRELADLVLVVLGHLVVGLGEFGSKWNKVKSAEIGCRLDLGRDKSALGMI